MKNYLLKACSLALVFVMLLSVCSVYAAADESNKDDADYERVISLLSALGIYSFDGSAENSEIAVTRNEFAEALASLHLIDEAVKQPDPYFTDISETHIANMLVKYGYFKEFGAKFEGEKTVDYIYAIKCLIKAIGLEQSAVIQGGSDAAYIATAKKMGIIDGAAHGKELTRKELVYMLRGTLEAESGAVIASSAGDYVIELTGKPFRESHLNIYHGEGIVGANAYAKVFNDIDVTNSDSLNIAGKIYDCFIEGSQNFIGQYVEFYYINADNPEIIYIVRDDSCEETVIDADNNGGYSNGSLKYHINDRAYSKKLDSSTVYIINGETYFALENSVLQSKLNITRGSIKVYENNDRLTCVIVDDRENAVVTRVDALNGTIYANSFGTDVKINTDNRQYLKMRYNNGNSLSLDTLKMNDVITYAESENGEYLDIICSIESVQGKVDSLKSTGNEISVKVNDTIYGVDREFYAYNPLKSGDTYVLMLDAYGKITASHSWTDKWNIGVVMGVESDTWESELKLLDQTGAIAVFELKNNIKFDGSRISHSQVCANIKATGRQLIRYYVNTSGQITSIDTAAQSGSETELYTIAGKDTRVFIGDQENPTSGYYTFIPTEAEINAGNREYLMNNETKVFIIPDDVGADGENCQVKIARTYLQSKIKYDVSLYKASDSTPFVDWCVVEGMSTLPASGTLPYMVNGLMQVYENEQTYTVVEGLASSSGLTEQMKFADSVDIWGWDESKPSGQKDVLLHTVSGHEMQNYLAEGDLYQKKVDAQNYIIGIKILFDYSENKPYWTTGYESQEYSTWLSAASTDKARCVYGNVEELYESYSNLTAANQLSVVTTSDFANNEVKECYTMSVSYSRCAIFDESRKTNPAYYGRLGDVVSRKVDAANASKIFVFWNTERPRAIFYYK